jgi:diadenosine tetraphosphatase ApaH/serine/threonine PP2A family protein phosphatase
LAPVRVLLLADIHANLAAFEAAVAAAEAAGGFDAVWVLGDIVGYGPDPGACISLLRSLDHLAVAGNHDRAATGQIGTEEFNPLAAAAARWTAASLTPDEKAYLASLPATAVAGEFTLVHGSLRDPGWEYLLSAEAAAAQLARQATPYGLVGHSHLQLTFMERPDGLVDGQARSAGERASLVGRRAIANPGGVGQPRDGDPRAPYAILDTDAREIAFVRVEYDIPRTQARMREAGLPAPLIDRLARGR